MINDALINDNLEMRNMNGNDTRSRRSRIYRVTMAGGAVNVVLLLFKFVAGIVGNSAAMLADAVHSLSDFVTDIIVILFVRISDKPKDKSHDYGHGKFETLAMTIIGLALLAVAVGILYSGVTKIVAWAGGQQLKAPGLLALWAALLSVVLKEAVFRYSMVEARRLQSQAVEANAWHHRSDALSSIGTAIGIGGAIFLGQRWTVLDPVASVVVGLFIVKVSFDLVHWRPDGAVASRRGRNRNPATGCFCRGRFQAPRPAHSPFGQPLRH